MEVAAAGVDNQAVAARRRVLFIAEAVTLAHVGRTFALARTLAEAGYDIHFAAAPRYRHLLGHSTLTHHEVFSIAPESFFRSLASGRPAYNTATLKRYAEDDLRLMAEVRPDAIVGDFRLSLSASARVAEVPYVTVSNAYWSPYATQRYVVPELPITTVLGPTVAQAIFGLVRPLAFALHAAPLNRLRRHYGLPSLGADLRRVYTDADLTLYADIPELVETRGLPPSHRYIGPVSWAPQTAIPVWWDEITQNSPIVYVTMGSSGAPGLMAEILEGLGALPIQIMVSQAGRALQGGPPDNAYLADYLPGDLAAARASVVVCNGGSPTCYQALAGGAPVVGVPNNLDQYLNMACIRRAGAGVAVRAGRASARNIALAVSRCLEDKGLAHTAQSYANLLRKYDFRQAFVERLAEFLKS